MTAKEREGEKRTDVVKRYAGAFIYPYGRLRQAYYGSPCHATQPDANCVILDQVTTRVSEDFTLYLMV